MLDHGRPRAARGVERFASRSTVGLLALLIGSLGFLLLMVLVRTAWAPLYRADQRVADTLNAWVAGKDLLLAALRGLTDFGGHTILMRVLVLATAYLLIRRQVRLAAYVVVTALGALILDPTLKLLVGRLRPVVDMPVAFAPGMSFPSGHALGSFVSYGVLVLVFMPAVPRRWRTPFVSVAVLLVAVVGFTRIALGVHHISDVLAGWLLGAAWLAITAGAFRQWHGDGRAGIGDAGAGLAPEARDELRPAPAEDRVLARPWRVAAELAVAWVMVLGLVYGAGLLVTDVLSGFALVASDEAAVRWFVEQRRPVLDPLATVGSRIGNTHSILTATLAAVVLIVAWRRRLRPIVFLAAVMLGEVTLFLVTSSVVNRPRPAVPALGPEIPPTASFPSGHVAAPLCLYGALAVLTWQWSGGWLRWVTATAAAVIPLCVALARLYWGVHHPLDLAGSLLLAAGWVTACWYAVRPGHQPGARQKEE
ncbi:phosphatase PAP2 family protein [Pseudosporangium ferrugineum]|uniref:Undecaprenyl-diphosphatase n=1 Tax=Pseudosporangium ferrugineum TaxID=439699 RepID=A0A2T0RGE1_9ACTN|nr:phosphatase PAP2 family protein [Pseudosporangium ferrugineum]PRY20202.1 undecaprenyl-diphosphatase [Pseudosporangium ferrugineum]